MRHKLQAAGSIATIWEDRLGLRGVGPSGREGWPEAPQPGYLSDWLYVGRGALAKFNCWNPGPTRGALAKLAREPLTSSGEAPTDLAVFGLLQPGAPLDNVLADSSGF